MSCANFKKMDNFNLFIRDYDEKDYFLVRDIEEALEELNRIALFSFTRFR